MVQLTTEQIAELCDRWLKEQVPKLPDEFWREVTDWLVAGGPPPDREKWIEIIASQVLGHDNMSGAN